MKSIRNKQILILQEIEDEHSTGLTAGATRAGA
jgi:hypothetical protein